MSYQVWSVVFGEQPSASKWNILGSNDASFNDGTGIAAEAIQFSHLDIDNIITNQQAWQNPTLLNSWINYETPQVDFPPASYYKDSLGIVHFRGLIKSGTTAANTVLFVLPVGYRPAYDFHIPVASGNAFCVIRPEAAGNVEISGGASASWIDLSSIQFRAA